MGIIKCIKKNANCDLLYSLSNTAVHFLQIHSKRLAFGKSFNYFCLKKLPLVYYQLDQFEKETDEIKNNIFFWKIDFQLYN